MTAAPTAPAGLSVADVWSIDKIDLSDWHILGPSNGFCADIIATVHSTDLPCGEQAAQLIVAAPSLLVAAERLIAVFEQQKMTAAERIIVGVSDARLRTEGNAAIAALRSAAEAARAQDPAS